jgi:hypothetical protein
MAIYPLSLWVFFNVAEMIEISCFQNRHKKKSYQKSVTRFGQKQAKQNNFNTNSPFCQEKGISCHLKIKTGHL